ncbi:MAG: hypothetical protein B6D61_13605 [Bacteroidetes bacterium 4484_249]|nr:MAG: hypothetical protein B6D61_13605 [Bacteroidetes bacterium 4484_249]
MKTVGIIGGLGPETTSEFYLDIIFSCQERDNTNRPSIIISNVPLSYKVEQEAILYNKGVERFLPLLTNEAKRLEKAGADFIVMPCNSLHMFIKELRESVNIPVLSIIEETVNYVKRKKIDKIGVIATAMTVKYKLYENEFQANNILYATPKQKKQSELDKIILNIVNGNKLKSDYDKLIKIIEDFESENVNGIILACTDLQLLKPNYPGLNIFDTMKIFADATVENIFK